MIKYLIIKYITKMVKLFTWCFRNVYTCGNSIALGLFLFNRPTYSHYYNGIISPLCLLNYNVKTPILNYNYDGEKYPIINIPPKIFEIDNLVIINGKKILLPFGKLIADDVAVDKTNVNIKIHHNGTIWATVVPI